MTNATALRKPSAADATFARAEAKAMGYSVRVARLNWSLRLIGKTEEVRDVAVLCGFVSATGVAATKPHTVPNYDGQTEFFAYVPA